MEIVYQTNIVPAADMITDLFRSSGIKRPDNDVQRIDRMFQNSNLVVTAWHDALLIGVARVLSDFSYSSYLSDLAVRKEYQNLGIGRKLVDLCKANVGDESMLLLVAAPAAAEYYPKIGMEKVNDAFILKRIR